MEKQKISGREIILDVGSRIVPGFNLDDPERFATYQQIYGIITRNLTSDLLQKRDQKGVLLLGPKGVGKSICFRVFHRMLKDTNRRFRYVKSTTIKDLVVDKVPLSEIKEEFGSGLHDDLYIDDLGFGQVDQNQFGNVVNIMAELIHDRDELYVTERRLTHFSTNLIVLASPNTDKTIANLYGERSADRLLQMNHIIKFKGQSLRQNG